MKWLIHALLALSICFPALSQPVGFRVVFINPGHPDKDATGRFWSNVNRFMQAAATDFGIDLISLYAQRNHLLMTSLVTQIDNLKPDYVILVNEKG
ncbi:hypothetical protein LJ739_18245 [Aestuariibacter halophilus]|uniref:Uncharacterized protein n=1 Tax=Fluctibacter halophilus TaxID=226011 RepID=A0ABS8GCI2_9ALTE|nr:hypothetical protein [Aestuariibacter halophilus]MCC2618203.1 hypothetical protein [Aestuariibacter halophilus]